ncbi:MAG: DoxX family protein [Verrucomicrobiales bacterium]|nr:DoxX family protein [Verrucomicrobiota bacterium JB025]
MKKLFFDCGTRDATASAGLLALRLLISLMMLFGHGLPKLRAFSEISDHFQVPQFFPLKYMSPPVSLGAAIFAEVLIPILLICGVATRASAFVLAFTMTIAAFHFHQASPWFNSTPDLIPTKELALLYLIPMITLIITGGGAYSADAGLYKERKRRLRW